MFFFFKQKTAYEMRISDWSSDVCSSDLRGSTNEPQSTKSWNRGIERQRPAAESGAQRGGRRRGGAPAPGRGRSEGQADDARIFLPDLPALRRLPQRRAEIGRAHV